jgi:hypothetical protein
MTTRRLLPFVVLASVVGCGRPDAANVELRKQNQELQERLTALERERAADRATIEALQQPASPGTTRPALSYAQLQNLVTVAGLKINRLTGPDPDDPKRGLKVYVVPTDTDGEAIKAAGSFVVEATDPTRSPEPLLGRWVFSTADARTLWYGRAMLHEYVLPAPWPQPVQAGEARIKVTFTDALTGRSFGPVETRVKLN